MKHQSGCIGIFIHRMQIVTEEDCYWFVSDNPYKMSLALIVSAEVTVERFSGKIPQYHCSMLLQFIGYSQLSPSSLYWAFKKYGRWNGQMQLHLFPYQIFLVPALNEALSLLCSVKSITSSFSSPFWPRFQRHLTQRLPYHPSWPSSLPYLADHRLLQACRLLFLASRPSYL